MLLLTRRQLFEADWMCSFFSFSFVCSLKTFPAHNWFSPLFYFLLFFSITYTASSLIQGVNVMFAAPRERGKKSLLMLNDPPLFHLSTTTRRRDAFVAVVCWCMWSVVGVVECDTFCVCDAPLVWLMNLRTSRLRLRAARARDSHRPRVHMYHTSKPTQDAPTRQQKERTLWKECTSFHKVSLLTYTFTPPVMSPMTLLLLKHSTPTCVR